MGTTYDIVRGISVLKEARAPYASGVYKMLSAEGEVIYVGKAKVLQKRITQYINTEKMPNRLKIMVSLIRHIEFFVTNSEIDALILEAKLIRDIKPKYNVLLKDDKSFPYIAIDTSHPFPRILKYRGGRQKNLELFGPFISSFHLEEVVVLLQKLFLLRTCSDSYFKNRTRPCMLYQIKKCSGPCVGNVDLNRYNDSVKAAMNVLTGSTKSIQAELLKKMEKASLDLEFERAAVLRDEVAALRKISDRISVKGGDCHIFALYQGEGRGCLQFTEIISSRIHDCHNMYFENSIEYSELSSIIINFYKSNIKKIDNIFISSYFEADIEKEFDVLATVLKGVLGKNCKIRPLSEIQDGDLIELVKNNVKNSLALKKGAANELENIEKLRRLLQIPGEVRRIEIYDNSHIFGSSAVGCMVVASQNGFEKAEYRVFKIGSTDSGDDIKMMKEVIKRRFNKDWALPQLIIIDGGITQLNAAYAILQEIGIQTSIIGIAKGKKRNAGEEKIVLIDGSEIKLSKRDSLLFYLQRLRDEAHRFAITTHRKIRDKKFISSEFEEIEFIGEKRKKILQSLYGSPKRMLGMSLNELENIPSFGKGFAKKLYVYLQQKKDI
ncbi:UvrABC system protein C [Candidatus Cyrtobacter comes]|uniref:UvrABC system protein C n=1 Tax=Candidatus Cyrtobacter comes TaxID=675776 RepID=A0ABU5L7P9_9RICK|nr:excinuclease ABC subunit UvrC [Candidatus Cyrtobacter comes]MDZ5762150.1 UvrABC system protein C [Candidatus Cyrtobacter comes]